MTKYTTNNQYKHKIQQNRKKLLYNESETLNYRICYATLHTSKQHGCRASDAVENSHNHSNNTHYNNWTNNTCLLIDFTFPCDQNIVNKEWDIENVESERKCYTNEDRNRHENIIWTNT